MIYLLRKKMMEISMIGENAFPQSVAGIEEKGGNAKNPHFLEYPERSGVVQILG
ncbi:MAG: hypothetical protein SOV79_14405 [Eisenbergiella porci]|uniref:hypothetical protein n=1 Tax=Eisenbergiella porci TaxID=2652274 RepID=UPI002A74EBE2|nr:hypothetical protein [Eisenbergiella porci]MDY2653749.1 hypothetical protein [Eisenbergiella porci]